METTSLQKFSKWVMQEVQHLNPDTTWTELSLVLTDDHGMTELNQAYFNKHESTDVISFAYAPMPGDHDGHTGEVIVNVECAVREGPAHAGASRELALYIAHGCQHLTGASDHTPELREAMRQQETKWLARAEKEGLLDGLVSDSNRNSSP